METVTSLDLWIYIPPSFLEPEYFVSNVENEFKRKYVNKCYYNNLILEILTDISSLNFPLLKLTDKPKLTLTLEVRLFQLNIDDEVEVRLYLDQNDNLMGENKNIIAKIIKGENIDKINIDSSNKIGYIVRLGDQTQYEINNNTLFKIKVLKIYNSNGIEKLYIDGLIN